MKKICIVILSHICLFVVGQKKCDLVYGDLRALTGQSTTTVIVDFDSLTIAGYGTEAQFTAQLKKRFEADKAGEGDKWEKGWNEKRTAVFARRFKTLFHKCAKLDSMAIADYAFIFRPTKIYTGFNSDDETPKAFLSGVIYLVERTAPKKALAKITFENIPGEGIVADPTGGLRVGDSYAIAGKIVGNFIASSMKKNKKSQ